MSLAQPRHKGWFDLQRRVPHYVLLSTRNKRSARPQCEYLAYLRRTISDMDEPLSTGLSELQAADVATGATGAVNCH